MIVSHQGPAIRLRRWLRQAFWCVIVVASLLFLARSGAPIYSTAQAAEADEPNSPHLPILTTANDFKLPGTLEMGLTTPLQGCTGCHSDHISKSYSGSMMANSARDPLFRAALSVAVKDANNAGSWCIRCHVPNAWLNGRAEFSNSAEFEPEDMAGVTCNVCHRLVSPYAIPGESPRNPAERAHIETSQNTDLMIGSAAYIVDREDDRRGPYALNDNFHLKEQDSFMRSSLMCATCHEIDNPLLTFNPATQVFELNAINTPPAVGAKLFPVERTYSEWEASQFNTPGGVTGISNIYPGQKRIDGTSTGAITVCQDCHMPMRIETLTTMGTPDRRLGEHNWAGGSGIWQEAIAEFWGGINEDALFDDAAEQATRDAMAEGQAMLQRAAELSTSVEDRLLTITVVNNTGHKLPTGYAEGRRMWLELVFWEDSQEVEALRMGELDEEGNIIAPLKVYEIKQGISEEHAAALNRPELVGEGFHFALNNMVVKDNRIPPRGFTNAAYESKSMQPVGYSYADGVYTDTTTYLLPIGVDEVDVYLHYQATSGEYLDFLEEEGDQPVPEGILNNQSFNWGEIIGDLRETYDLDRGIQMAYSPTGVPGVAIAKFFEPSSNLLPGQPLTITMPFTDTGEDALGIEKVGIADLIPSSITDVSVGYDLTPGTTLNEFGVGTNNLSWTVNGNLLPHITNTIIINGKVNAQISADTVIANTVVMSASAGTINRSTTATASVVVPRVSFAPATYSGEEDAGTIQVTVTMNKANPYAATSYTVSTQNGAAKAGSDFVALDNKLVTIPPGQTSATFNVELVNDEQAEFNEGFAVVLTGATAAAVGTTDSATITIQNEDAGTPPPGEEGIFLPLIPKEE